jgi:paired amphipathic helix protein Sin3a
MQTQTILGDMKSQELFALLQRDRSGENTTTRQQIAYRMQAEGVLGSDENLYKIEHHQGETISVQLLGREDLTIDDAETTQEKWRQYIESYVLVSRGCAHLRTIADLSRRMPPRDSLAESTSHS